MAHDNFNEFNPNNPYTQLALLAQRVDNLGREKEELERRIEADEVRLAKMERTMTMGWGVIVVIPILGSIVGFVAMYAKTIFSPWTGR